MIGVKESTTIINEVKGPTTIVNEAKGSKAITNEVHNHKYMMLIMKWKITTTVNEVRYQ